MWLILQHVNIFEPHNIQKNPKHVTVSGEKTHVFYIIVAKK